MVAVKNAAVRQVDGYINYISTQGCMATLLGQNRQSLKGYYRLEMVS